MSIELGNLIKRQKLDSKEIAIQLFPDAKNPDKALRRVINGYQELSASQISKLSAITGIPLPAIFSNTGFTASYSDGVHTFMLGDFTAKLDTSSWTTKLYKQGNMVVEEVIHDRGLPLSEYFQILNKQISKIKNR